MPTSYQTIPLMYASLAENDARKIDQRKKEKPWPMAHLLVRTQPNVNPQDSSYRWKANAIVVQKNARRRACPFSNEAERLSQQQRMAPGEACHAQRQIDFGRCPFEFFCLTHWAAARLRLLFCWAIQKGFIEKWMIFFFVPLGIVRSEPIWTSPP